MQVVPWPTVMEFPNTHTMGDTACAAGIRNTPRDTVASAIPTRRVQDRGLCRTSFPLLC